MTEPAFLSGKTVAEYVDVSHGSQIQPAGVDLTIDKLYKQAAGLINKGEKEVGKRIEQDSIEGHWILDGPRVVQYAETIEIPENCVGFVFPRSTLMRNAVELHTAVWDPGYKGVGEGLLVPHTETVVEQGARIAQIVYATTDPDEVYDGSYQHERLDDE